MLCVIGSKCWNAFVNTEFHVKHLSSNVDPRIPEAMQYYILFIVEKVRKNTNFHNS